ncbi:MAG: hypothetical protein JO081_07525 [Alphaproteobacteria bacterium]|nr:hypothetical protein [Alphaproteobacteria bacterium]
MTDRLSLANALADANIDRAAAERIATEIFDALQSSVATKSALQRLESGMKSDLDRLETATKAEFQAMRAEVQALEQRMLLRFSELEHRLTVRFASVMVVLIGLLFAALRYLPPAH